MTAEWLREYEFLQAFPGHSHADYVDMADGGTEWLLRIHRMVTEDKRRRESATERGPNLLNEPHIS